MLSDIVSVMFVGRCSQQIERTTGRFDNRVNGDHRSELLSALPTSCSSLTQGDVIVQLPAEVKP